MVDDGNRRGSSYYATRSRQLLRGFDRFAKRIRCHLAVRHGEAFADEVLAATRTEFIRLIPKIPYIGGRRNIFTPVMIVNAWGVALYRSMHARGHDAAEVVRLCASVADEVFRSIPKPILALAGRLAFAAPMRWLLARQAARSQRRRYPEDFVYAFRTGDGDDGALVFTECAVNKFYVAQEATDLAPYCNFFDVTYSRLMGMGLDASETIGLGCTTCRLRYRRGRETRIPKTLERILPQTPDSPSQV